ncbi:MAG: hypothetical protein HKN62_11350, partial [Phycisphaerales bacterium]|nr:hypothetical protein [Phycisphaerales bacterium]
MLNRVISLVVAFALTPLAPAQIFVVDFEGFAEQTEISDQYADLGVTFSIDGDPTRLPVIANEGSPTIGFNGSGADRPMPSQLGGLTDPLVDGSFTVGLDIAMEFDPPVTGARFFVADIDGSETIVARVYDGAKQIDELSVSAGDPGTGNGTSTPFPFAAPSITRIVVDVPDNTGFAIDFLTFTRPCAGPGCGVRIQVAQESAPGRGDFDENVLGFVRPFPFAGSAAEFYAYNVPQGDSWNGPALTPEPDRSHVVFAGTSDGLTICLVHDRAFPDDPDGGRAETWLEITDDPDGAIRTVADDPDTASDSFTGEPGDSLFTSAQEWSPCCTDGMAISGIDCRTTSLLQFTNTDGSIGSPAIRGMVEWFVYSATDEPIEL